MWPSNWAHGGERFFVPLHGASSSDEDLFGRIERAAVITPDSGLPTISGQPRFTGSYSFGAGARRIGRIRREGEASFSQILAEVESARFAVARAMKTVMLGAQAALRPELVEPGAGPPGVNGMLDAIRDLEARVRAASPGKAGLILCEPPASRAGARRAGGEPPELSVRYLRPSASSGACLCLALSFDDCRALGIDAFGRLSAPPGKVVGVAPLLLMPPGAMAEEARRNETRYADRAGLGSHIPTFVRLYTEFAAFAIQNPPMALAIGLLADQRRPDLAARLEAIHARLVAEATAATLHFLGYEDSKTPPSRAVGRRARDAEVLDACGMRLFDAIAGWRHACRGSVDLDEFVRSFCELRVEKVGNLVQHALRRRTLPPPPAGD